MRVDVDTAGLLPLLAKDDELVTEIDEWAWDANVGVTKIAIRFYLKKIRLVELDPVHSFSVDSGGVHELIPVEPINFIPDTHTRSDGSVVI